MGLALCPANEQAQTCQELVTKAHDMEATIAISHGTSFGFVESNKNKVEFKRNVELSKNSNKEVTSIFEDELV